MVARVAYFPLQELSWIRFWPMHHFSSFLSTPCFSLPGYSVFLIARDESYSLETPLNKTAEPLLFGSALIFGFSHDHLPSSPLLYLPQRAPHPAESASQRWPVPLR